MELCLDQHLESELGSYLSCMYTSAIYSYTEVI
jgi:hypothetical protein